MRVASLTPPRSQTCAPDWRHQNSQSARTTSYYPAGANGLRRDMKIPSATLGWGFVMREAASGGGRQPGCRMGQVKHSYDLCVQRPELRQVAQALVRDVNRDLSSTPITHSFDGLQLLNLQEFLQRV